MNIKSWLDRNIKTDQADYLLEGKHRYHNHNISIRYTNMFLLEIDVHPLVDEDQKTGDDTAHQNSHNHFDNYEMVLFRDNHTLYSLKM